MATLRAHAESKEGYYYLQGGSAMSEFVRRWGIKILEAQSWTRWPDMGQSSKLVILNAKVLTHRCYMITAAQGSDPRQGGDLWGVNQISAERGSFRWVKVDVTKFNSFFSAAIGLDLYTLTF